MTRQRYANAFAVTALIAFWVAMALFVVMLAAMLREAEGVKAFAGITMNLALMIVFGCLYGMKRMKD